MFLHSALRRPLLIARLHRAAPPASWRLRLPQVPSRKPPFLDKKPPVRASFFPGQVVGGVALFCASNWVLAYFAIEHEEKQARPSYQYRPRNPPAQPPPLVSYKWILDNLVLSQHNVDMGRLWTLITHTLIHFSGTHLALNMVGLISFGRAFVAAYGVPHFLALWIVGGVAGGLASLWAAKHRKHWGQHRPGIEISCGASASVLAISVAKVMAEPRMRVLVMGVPMPGWLWMSGLAISSVFCELTGTTPGIGHAAHLAGMVFGAVWWGTFLRYPGF